MLARLGDAVKAGVFEFTIPLSHRLLNIILHPVQFFRMPFHDVQIFIHSFEVPVESSFNIAFYHLLVPLGHAASFAADARSQGRPTA
jgi:hypothetical protein